MLDHQKFEKLKLNDKAVFSKPVRRRQRQTLSCLPCRRLKVKCDRGHPCRHCVWSDRAASCQYAPFPTAQANSINSSDEDQTGKSSLSPQAPIDRAKPALLLPKTEPDLFDSSPAATTSSSKSEESVKSIYDPYNSWNSKFRGSTHWLTVSRQIQYGHKSMSGNPLYDVLEDVFNKITNNFTSSIFPSNYPFGCGYQEQFPSKREVLTYIPDRPTIMFLIDVYMNTIERTHPMLHPPTFYKELDNFWEDPAAVEDEWLAQFLVMLGMSHHMSRGVNITPDEEATLKQYFRGAETCLKSTIFLIAPNLTSLRTLSMMVLARRILASSCLELDACGPLSAIVMRMAIGIGLHVDPQNDVSDSTSLFDREIRKKLWSTIAMMCTNISVLTGTPFALRSSHMNTQPPLNLNDIDLSPSLLAYPIPRPLEEFTDSTFLIIVANSFQLAFDTVAHANSPTTYLPYEDVLIYNVKIKNLLLEATQLYHQSSPVPLEDWKQDQLFMLQVYLRRLLLALHSVYGLQPNADVEYPVSYWATLESALALLVIQRQLSEDLNSPPGRVWLGEYYKHDFYAATLTICLIMTRNDAVAMDINSNGPSQTNLEIPRETILQTLICCRDIWARRICQTYCHFLSYMNLGTIIASIMTPRGKNIHSTEVYKSSLRESLRMLKNCPCGKCATDSTSVKGSFLNHPEYLAV
ncbi:C6 transcription factor, putative [Talaromyces stipitatus ATCC 10500]|uniref:C6 transcription factor, putative n=1 Tax=Talaromyces stipitatus (strain ATCC 10500 / CBS 375.48 / QM 6759 / NRRL 1006) TaxID=441959 RepID=B8MTI4_TALSN|nr:C6 transcription factor, putative [Talaromyces stipitatus ATCC 10500]EED12390.1 C6 transcription factor, putative [Talaromyces stipitatus ATCC 10500]